jgi:hypothetical protein
MTGSGLRRFEVVKDRQGRRLAVRGLAPTFCTQEVRGGVVSATDARSAQSVEVPGTLPGPAAPSLRRRSPWHPVRGTPAVEVPGTALGGERIGARREAGVPVIRHTNLGPVAR